MMSQNQMHNNGFKPQVQQQPLPAMNNFGVQKMMQQPPVQTGQNNTYGGLVNLSNLGSNGFNGNQGGIGNQGFSMGGAGVGVGGNTANGMNQQKKDVFSGLMNNQW